MGAFHHERRGDTREGDAGDKLGVCGSDNDLAQGRDFKEIVNVEKEPVWRQLRPGGKGFIPMGSP